MLNCTHYFRDQRSCRWYLLRLLIWLLSSGGAAVAQAQESFFEPVPTARGRLPATARNIPNSTLYKLNETGLRNSLVKPGERDKTTIRIALPLPDGTTEVFLLRETQTMSPELAATLPTVKTYEGEGTVHKDYIIRTSLTSLGFEALIWGVSSDAVYIVPVEAGSGSTLYQSYYARDAKKVGAANGMGPLLRCGTVESAGKPVLPGLKSTGKGLRTAAAAQISAGGNLRVFRIAIATTGEWTRNAGNYAANPNPATVRVNALGVIVTAINRINGIYLRELACTFQIVNPNINNSATNLIFDDPATDPYDNTDNTNQLTINQTTVDNRRGPTNYDVGHLFGTGGGGVALSPSLCINGVKAEGYSARGTDVGDPFFVDYFAHELGHQLDMKHTYNVSDADGACTTRSPEEAYEVASGSTIMSYVGICNEGRNLQQYNDFNLPSFHISSLTKANEYLVGVPSGCGTVSSGSNAIPVVSVPAAYVIPRLTPFTLKATATDGTPGDGANLLYSWEELDLAPSPTGARGVPVDVYDIDDDGVSRPILRAYSPVSSPERTFPSPAFILNPQNNATPGDNQPVLLYTGTHPTGYPGTTCPTGQTCIVGERLPTIARTMNFRVSVRDRRGGVADAGTSISIVNTPGAFRLTSFDNASTVAGNSQQTVTWNVVNTNQAPINCVNVAIKLSTDGGITFPTTLLASTPNDGSESVMMPNVTTSTARLRVEAVGNIFFDISNTNFTITPAPSVTSPVAVANPNQVATVDSPFAYIVNAFTGTAPITYAASGVPTGLSFDALTRVLSGTPTSPGSSIVTITGTNSTGQATTSFTLTVNPSVTPTPSGAFVITAVTTVSCTSVAGDANRRSLTFTPQYSATTGQPISFSVTNELRPTTAPGPYTLGLYIDNPAITLKATQAGTAGEASFTYNWLANCGATTPTPTPSSPFAITAVTTVSCTSVAGDANRRSLTFTPQYSATTGQPISFSVTNELRPTTAPGPYTLGLYIDNPVITLKATQAGTAGEASFTYNWLANCSATTVLNRAARGAGIETSLVVRVLGNPIVDGRIRVEVEGAAGQTLQLMITDTRGTLINTHRVEQSNALETYSVDIGHQPVGTLLLRVATPGQVKTVTLLKAE
jgi:hypothetical protein